MTALSTTVFSEYEVRRMFVTVGDDTCEVKCIGSLEEETDAITVSKKCRGVVVKKRTRGTGTGTLKVSLHMPWKLYTKLSGMESESLAEGVVGYGRSSTHPEFTATADVFDEDDVEKFKAWPKCVLNAVPAAKVENGSEEVAELEAEIGYMPDDNGFGHYEALADGLTEDIKGKWLESFTSDLVLRTA